MSVKLGILHDHLQMGPHELSRDCNLGWEGQTITILVDAYWTSVPRPLPSPDKVEYLGEPRHQGIPVS